MLKSGNVCCNRARQPAERPGTEGRRVASSDPMHFLLGDFDWECYQDNLYTGKKPLYVSF